MGFSPTKQNFPPAGSWGQQQAHCEERSAAVDKHQRVAAREA
jgi:hypothetical protein